MFGYNVDETLVFDLDDDDDDLVEVDPRNEECNEGGVGNATTSNAENFNCPGVENPPDFGRDWSSWSRSARWENENE